MINTKFKARASLSRVAALVLAFGLTGCSIAPQCSNEGQPYLEARAIPPVRIPSGLDAPNRSAALNVPAPPEASVPARPAAGGQEGKCLEDAPSYFGNAISPLSSPEDVVAIWAQAWSERNTERMMAAYSPEFAAPEGMTSATWLEQRKEQAATGPVPDSRVQNVRVSQPAPDRRVITFAQRFDTNTIRRELTLAREGGFWRIVAEQVLDLE